MYRPEGCGKNGNDIAFICFKLQYHCKLVDFSKAKYSIRVLNWGKINYQESKLYPVVVLTNYWIWYFCKS